MKLLKARQKKHLRGTIKKIVQEVEQQNVKIQALEVEVNLHRA
jgi:hypothetical protein